MNEPEMAEAVVLTEHATAFGDSFAPHVLAQFAADLPSRPVTIMFHPHAMAGTVQAAWVEGQALHARFKLNNLRFRPAQPLYACLGLLCEPRPGQCPAHALSIKAISLVLESDDPDQPPVVWLEDDDAAAG